MVKKTSSDENTQCNFKIFIKNKIHTWENALAKAKFSEQTTKVILNQINWLKSRVKEIPFLIRNPRVIADKNSRRKIRAMLTKMEPSSQIMKLSQILPAHSLNKVAQKKNKARINALEENSSLLLENDVLTQDIINEVMPSFSPMQFVISNNDRTHCCTVDGNSRLIALKKYYNKMGKDPLIEVMVYEISDDIFSKIKPKVDFSNKLSELNKVADKVRDTFYTHITFPRCWIELKNLFENHIFPFNKDREKLHDTIISKVFANNDPVPWTNTPKVQLMMGGLGSGKSTVISEMLQKEVPCPVVDADEFKVELPEYKTHVGNDSSIALKTHNESIQIKYKAIKYALKTRRNVCIDGTGINASIIKKRIQEFHNLGYKVELVLVDVESETALKRVRSRTEKTGRAVPENQVISGNKKARVNFEQLKNLADTYLRFDNNNKEPTLVESNSFPERRF